MYLDQHLCEWITRAQVEVVLLVPDLLANHVPGRRLLVPIGHPFHPVLGVGDGPGCLVHLAAYVLAVVSFLRHVHSFGSEFNYLKRKFLFMTFIKMTRKLVTRVSELCVITSSLWRGFVKQRRTFTESERFC